MSMPCYLCTQQPLDHDNDHPPLLRVHSQMGLIPRSNHLIIYTMNTTSYPYLTQLYKCNLGELVNFRVREILFTI